MRVLVFHGYLLSGTGSNVYNARLAEALVRAGHEVHLFCQDRRAAELGFVEASGDWEGGRLDVRGSENPRCTAYRPDIGRLLPVYVADRYEGFDARPFPELSDVEVERYVQANVAAVAEVAERVAPDLALANHLVMGPVILARALAGSHVSYAVKVHGSALEYTVKRSPERFLPYAREGLAPASGILVGSRHTAESLWAAMGDPSLPARTRLGPPGVDVRRFGPRDPADAAAGLRALAARLSSRPSSPAPAGGDAFARDPALAGAALARLDPGSDRLVAFVGKLIVSKGVDLLAAAWPLVLDAEPAARLVVVGFGAYEHGLRRLLDALATGDLDQVREIARAGRSLEVDDETAHRPLALLLAFLESLSGEESDSYLRAARRLPDRVVLTGRLDHDELADLLPACEAEVVPSTFPEAFGMVAVEAAACGALPISADHSGLAEVSRRLAQGVPQPAAGWLSFPLDGDPVRGLAGRVVAWLRADPSLRLKTREALVRVTADRWSWDGVARSVIAAADGRLDELPEP